MADIAMLVAEEYERRIKHSRKISSSGGGGGAAEEEEEGRIRFVSRVSMGRMKKVVGEENMEMMKWVLEPKSQIGLAAIDGFFSA